MILKNLFSKIVLDAFTFEPNVAELFPIQSSIKFMPSWWKNLPMEYFGTSPYGAPYPISTIKRCPGVIELYKRSLTMPLWADVALASREDGSWAFHSEWKGTVVESHPREQYGPAFNNHIHLKFNSPWMIREKTGVHFCYNTPMWHEPDRWDQFFIAPGLIEFKYQRASHVNAFVGRTNRNMLLNAGDPLVQLIPMTEKTIEVRSHVVSEQEHKNLWNETNKSFFFTNSYRKYVKMIESKK
jgi:hypothetical protein